MPRLIIFLSGGSVSFGDEDQPLIFFILVYFPEKVNLNFCYVNSAAALK